MNGQTSNETQNRQTTNPNSQQEPIVIGFSTPDLNDRFLRYLEIAARVYAEQQNVEFILADAEVDQQTQYRQIEEMIRDDGVQGLIVIPVDTNAMQPVTDMARQAGIPLVYLNRKPFPGDEVPPGVYFVGSNPVDAGIKQADFLGEHLQSGNIGILMGIPNDANTVGRTIGLEEELAAKYPRIMTIVRGYADFFRKPAYFLVKQWLAEYGDNLNAIAANNDEMALGAIQALQEAGRNDVMVVGIDGLLPGREAVQKGTMAATVFQDANTQGEIAVDLIEQLVRGQKPAQQITLVPHILITSGVINEYPPEA